LFDITFEINTTKIKGRIKECTRRKKVMVEESKKPHHKKICL
jgi:hypothetical protein